LWGPDSLNGIDGAIVGPSIDLSGPSSGFPDGFKTQGPVVQNAMVFTFTIAGSLTEDEIGNVTPLFGSDGSVTAPAPPAVVLCGLGLAIGGIVMRKRQSAETSKS
jgi:MFS-type transporter involved in bile tolerance (Atg22 family)